MGKKTCTLSGARCRCAQPQTHCNVLPSSMFYSQGPNDGASCLLARSHSITPVIKEAALSNFRMISSRCLFPAALTSKDLRSATRAMLSIHPGLLFGNKPRVSPTAARWCVAWAPAGTPRRAAGREFRRRHLIDGVSGPQAHNCCAGSVAAKKRASASSCMHQGQRAPSAAFTCWPCTFEFSWACVRSTGRHSSHQARRA